MKKLVFLVVLVGMLYFTGSGIKQAIASLTSVPGEGSSVIAGPAHTPRFLNATERVMGIQ